MDFNNKLQPMKARVSPREEQFAEMMEKFETIGLKRVKSPEGDYFSYTDPKTGKELFNTAFTPQNFNFFAKAIEQGIDPLTALKQRAKSEQAPKTKNQADPEFTETVTPLSYNEQGGVATENQPTSVKKVK